MRGDCGPCDLKRGGRRHSHTVLAENLDEGPTATRRWIVGAKRGTTRLAAASDHRSNDGDKKRTDTGSHPKAGSPRSSAQGRC
ncbi:hypothetical protein GCM10027056_32200 [Glaciibacter psychrotolerans]